VGSEMCIRDRSKYFEIAEKRIMEHKPNLLLF
jgi:hypothetical protein